MSHPRFRRFRRRTIAIVLAATALIGGGAAFAFFISQGTGSTSQTFAVGSAPTIPVNVSAQTVSGSALQPGGAAQTAVVKAQNPSSSSGNVSVTFSATIKQDGAGGIWDAVSSTYVDACPASWFSVSWLGTGTTVTTPVSIPPGTNMSVDTLSLKLTDSGTSQDACENLQPVVNVVAS